MALNAVQIVQRPDDVKTKSAHKGGGEFGSVVGGVIGGVAGAMAGTAAGGPGAGTVAGGMAGAAGGASLGSTVGNWIDPARQESTAVSRRIQAAGPQLYHSEQSDTLKQSLMALHSQPPEVQREYAMPLTHAYLSSIAKDYGAGGSGGSGVA